MSNILIDYKNQIAYLTINRPKALNALNKDIFDELKAFFKEGYQEYDDLAGVIITGSGDKAFAAGADIKEFLPLMEQDNPPNLSKRGQDIFFLIERFHKPVIALVNGFALGGGLELAMSCHIRIATPNAKFGLPETNLGLIPGYGGTIRLASLIGKARATELMITAGMIDAATAEKFGLASYVLEAEEAIAKAEKIISTSSTKGPTAVAKCLEQVFHPKSDYISEHEYFTVLLQSEECREGVSAFLEKRKPNF